MEILTQQGLLRTAQKPLCCPTGAFSLRWAIDAGLRCPVDVDTPSLPPEERQEDACGMIHHPAGRCGEPFTDIAGLTTRLFAEVERYMGTYKKSLAARRRRARVRFGTCLELQGP